MHYACFQVLPVISKQLIFFPLIINDKTLIRAFLGLHLQGLLLAKTKSARNIISLLYSVILSLCFYIKGFKKTYVFEKCPTKCVTIVSKNQHFKSIFFNIKMRLPDCRVQFQRIYCICHFIEFINSFSISNQIKNSLKKLKIK